MMKSRGWQSTFALREGGNTLDLVAESDQKEVRRHVRIWHRVLIGLAVCVGLIVIFHGPLLRAVLRHVVIYYASKDNLKVDFRLEGEPLSYLTVRNLHAVPTDASSIESVDIDSLHIDYSLVNLVRNGFSHFLQEVEARDAQVVLNPARAPPPKPHPKKKTTLPSLFPERIKLTNATLIIRESPNDFLVEHVDLDLNPRAPGELRIAKLQIPSGDNWSNLSGQTSYTDKNLVLRNLALGDQAQIQLLKLDASRIDSKALAIKLECLIGGGQLSASVGLTQTDSSLNVKIKLDAGKVAAGALSKFLAFPKDYLSGNIERFTMDGTGVIDAPKTWTGTLSLQLSHMDLPVMNLDRIAVELSAGQGRATLTSADMVQNQNEIHLLGSIELPVSVEDFGRTPTTLQVSGKLPDLKQLTAGVPAGLTGSIQFDGRIDVVGVNVQATIGVTGEAIGSSDWLVNKLNATLRASKKVAHGDNNRPWFADLHTATEFTLTGIRYQDCVIDSVQGSINGSDDVLGIDQFTLQRNQNELTVRGNYRLPEHLNNLLSQRVQLDVAFNAPEISNFWAAGSPNKIAGSLQMTGHVQGKQRVFDGNLSISGSNLKMRDLVVQRLNVQAPITNNVVHLDEATAILNDNDFAKASGTFDLQPPHQYSGKASAHIANLATLDPLLRAFGNQNQLAGSFELDWEGSGEGVTATSGAVVNAKAPPHSPPKLTPTQAVASGKSSGSLKVVLENGRYGNMQGLQANIDASYSPQGLDVPTISFNTDKMDFQAIARAKGDRLEIDKIQLDQGQAKFASGYISIPFVWSNLGTGAEVIPPSGKVSATVQVESLDLKKLAENLGIKSNVSGTLNASLDASGTIADLKARLVAQAQNLLNQQWPKMEPASFELTADVAQNRLTLSGKLQQARIQPLEVGASMPLNVSKIVRARGLPDDTPISAKARLPRSSVNFVRQFVPELAQLDGGAALDVDVSGTIGKPVFSGAADVTVNVARFTDPTLPALRNFAARLTFARDALNFDRFGGDLAGGSVNVSGRIVFPKLTQPTLDLQLRGNSALLARNDTLTVRADANIKIAGPLASAAVTGDVALTDSHILKNIELIPIGLPGRPPPQPPSAAPELSVTTPPLRDWKFDVAIKTKTPVEIRGNLATGGATADLKLNGTGLHPGLQGVVQLQNVEATLPFSRLEVSQGLLTFDPSDSMNPKISLQGTSVIRDYTVRVYVYGTVESPQAIFSSEPPLPQEEIISLIATGATRQELSGTNVLAGRAAMLLLQELYRKIVKKGQPVESNTFFNRMDLDLGTVDPRTGEQQATVRFKIDDHLVLVGDVGVRGDFRGRLKYLIRFR